MKERNLHKKIEEQNMEEKKVVWQDIEPNICQKKSSKAFFVRYKRLFVALASCFVCIAVILPRFDIYFVNDTTQTSLYSISRPSFYDIVLLKNMKS